MKFGSRGWTRWSVLGHLNLVRDQNRSQFGYLLLFLMRKKKEIWRGQYDATHKPSSRRTWRWTLNKKVKVMSKLKRLRTRLISSSKMPIRLRRPKISFIKIKLLSEKISLLQKLTRWTWLIDWKSVCQSRSRLQLSVWRRGHRHQNEREKVIRKRKSLWSNRRLG